MIKFNEEKLSLRKVRHNFSEKMSYLGIFRLQFEKTIVIFEFSAL